MVDEIKENKGITTAQITSSNKDYREWAFFLYYTYKVDGIVYKGHSSQKISGKNLDDFMNRYFPLVYSTKNPGKSILLITPNDFNRWGMQFPDSLIWVKSKLSF